MFAESTLFKVLCHQRFIGGILFFQVWVLENCEVQVSLEVLSNDLIEDTGGLFQLAEVPSNGDIIRFELGHCILSEATSAEANALAEGTNPLGVGGTLGEAQLVVGLQTEGTELA